ncbi:hypothetical protein [Tissierella praeacuta]
MAKNRSGDRNIAPSLIWVCLGCTYYLISKNWIFLVVGVILSGVLYVMNN